ncbi:hypothetical protein SAMN05518863_102182 [Candidatus Pantoea symbiotica]|jgi:hypothetical protein|uniref:Uncharacterized protein n=1 Tax=Candidatus Pantoea symbiotica TaxID=1884370 RepID=A0A1I3T2L4_9GAMM|nr:hypothetical protein SAMN05518863_102182 [Pantoea symbiotica]SFU52707.1 hypothetical protein SAMN05518864_102415 [Pantoea sp. YR525]
MLGFVYLIMFLYAILSSCIIALIYWILSERAYFSVLIVWFLSVIFSFFFLGLLEYYGIPIIR